MKWARVPTAIGILLLVGSAYCWYWLYSHGGFSTRQVEIPIRLAEGSSVSVSFIVREEAEHYILIDYPNADVRRFLSTADLPITGKATLISRGGVVAQADLPTGHGSGWKGHSAMVLLDAPTKRGEYTLLLRIDRIPPDLALSEAKIRVGTDSLYAMRYPPIEFLAVLSLVLALFCICHPIRRQAGGLKRPYFFIVITSAAMIILGYAAMRLLPEGDFFSNVSLWTHVISKALVVVGALALVISLASWFVASVISYFRSRHPQSAARTE